MLPVGPLVSQTAARTSTTMIPSVRITVSSRNFSLVSLVEKFLQKNSMQVPNIKYLPEKKIQELIDRNFNQKLEELAKKSEETASRNSSNLQGSKKS